MGENEPETIALHVPLILLVPGMPAPLGADAIRITEDDNLLKIEILSADGPGAELCIHSDDALDLADFIYQTCV